MANKPPPQQQIQLSSHPPNTIQRLSDLDQHPPPPTTAYLPTKHTIMVSAWGSAITLHIGLYDHAFSCHYVVVFYLKILVVDLMQLEHNKPPEHHHPLSGGIFIAAINRIGSMLDT
eukprot:scaffold8843_cov76-Cyclotella_meneghiniana.AAC.5